MAEGSSVDSILEFLRKNQFKSTEAALRSELGNSSDMNGFLRKLTLEEKDINHMMGEENGDIEQSAEGRGAISEQSSGEVSKELVIKEVECGTTRNISESKWKAVSSVGERKEVSEASGVSNRGFTFSKGSEDPVHDLYSLKYNPRNGAVDCYRNDGGITVNNLPEFQNFGQSKSYSVGVTGNGKAKCRSGEEYNLSEDKSSSWLGTGNTSKVILEPNYDSVQTREIKEINPHNKVCSAYSKDNISDDPSSRSGEPTHLSSDSWNDSSVKAAFPFTKGGLSSSYDAAAIGSMEMKKKEGKRKAENSDIHIAIKEQVNEVGRALYFGKSDDISAEKNICCLGFPLTSENEKEELPRLPPVRLKSVENSLNINWEEKFERDGPSSRLTSSDNTFLIGSYLDVPVGQEISSSGFATVGDGLSESVDYPNEYWDSDEYDDDDDVGYMRQPIEDETWFLAHEIDYPSDNEKGTAHGSVPDPQERVQTKDEDEDQSFAEEDSYFSGEQYFQGKNVEPITASDNPIGLTDNKMYGRREGNDLIAQYDGQLMDEEELNLMRAEPVWQGFVTQTNELILLGDKKTTNEGGTSRLDDYCMDDDQHGSVRSIGVGINSDAAEFGSELRESLVGGSSEGDLDFFCDHDVGIGGSKQFHQKLDKKCIDTSNRGTRRTRKRDSGKYVIGNDKCSSILLKEHADGGFSFPPPLSDGQLVRADSNKALRSDKSNAIINNDTEDCLNALIGSDDMLASWRRKSSDSSPVKSFRDDNNSNAIRSNNSTPSTPSTYGYAEREHAKKEEAENIVGAREEDPVASLEDEEAAAVQEQVRQIKIQEEEFETFNLKIVHRKNRTGFEEDKNFHVVLNSVIAGRYHVTEYLGSAAFSKAIQAHDLHTGMDVCVKIIKNNKDFFDQSLDEIKLLKFVNKHDPADKYHLLRLYDYFYYREHLLIVCELLKANLYEFHKFNRESGGEVYFTMPRLQSITIQCLEALQFLHGLGLIHCDLKPENILVKSYSRCEVKVIDLGSSCFETDHLCSYVQSRSYRAPEVILGLPYDKKIDIWSLGCILAELCTGNVLFQNDSPATLLARVIGIIGPIDQGMLAKGRDTYKYFTKNHMLYEKNQDTNRLEYLIPKKTSLRHRLPMGDQGFIDFVGHLLDINPHRRPSASQALKHPWLSFPYEPISS